MQTMTNANHWNTVISNLFILAFVGGIPLYAAIKRVDIFSTFVEGAKDGFDLAVKIIPYLVGFLVAIGMFRAAGGFDLLGHWFGGFLHKIGFPLELLPLALIRPFSGSAANGILADIAHTYGGSSWLAHAAATMMGSTETTFYVLMIYFGSVGITRARHAVLAGLIADLTGMVAAILVTHWLYRP